MFLLKRQRTMRQWMTGIALGVASCAISAALIVPAPAVAQSAGASSKSAKSSKPAAKPAARKQSATAVRKPQQASRSVRTQRVVAGKNRRGARAQRVAYAPPRPSIGQLQGLRTDDPLDLHSSVALITDQATGEVLFAKNDRAVLPIASITKLMTSLLVVEARQPMDEVLTISDQEIDTEKGTSSRLRIGAQLSRADAMHLALMNSENRAAHVLGRSYPGGLPAFVEAMNAKAALLGMTQTRFVDPTGLSPKNVSSARDLTLLMKAAYQHPELREYSTSPSYAVAVLGRNTQFGNTNRLVHNPEWQIGLQKTGYIAEAGKCLVMQALVQGRQVLMVFLDSAGKYSRLGDAQRVRTWLESRNAVVGGTTS
ncbi:peptidase S11 [beta proteobacterium AAP99]|nr:peptidase S11 [beta proteobacterium AAP99]